MKQEVYKPSNLFLSRLLSGCIKFFLLLFKKQSVGKPINNETITSICVLEYHCIGDVILITPALHLIRKNFPDATITLITNQSVQELIKAAKIADKLVSISAPWLHGIGSPKKWLSFYKQIRSLRKSPFDLGFNFKGDFRDLGLLWWIKPDIRIGFNATGGDFFLTRSYPFPFEKHQVERAIHLLSRAGLKTEFQTPALALPEEPVIQHDKNPRIIIHSGASHPLRRWPDNHWLKLIQLLQQNTAVTIVELPETTMLCKSAREQFPDIDVFKGSLLEFAQVVKKNSLLVGVDSMAVHLAIALGVPALALFGSQNPDLTRPYGPNGYVVTPASPCKHKRKNWRLCGACMNDIDPQTVYDTAIEIGNW